MFRRLLLGLALALVVQAPSAISQQRTVTVQLLAINDFHGNLEPPVGNGGRINGMDAGGAEYLATHLKRAREENRNSIVVGAGDLMGASPLLSALFNEAPAIEALDAMGLDVTSIGNHELDNGPEAFLQRVQGKCVARPRRPCRVPYQYLAANVARADGSALLPSSAVRRIGGVKVGFIGATLEGTASVIPAAAARDLRFAEEAVTVNAAAARLERQGVGAIVLLIHQGGRQQAAGPGAALDPNGCAGFNGEIIPVLARLAPSIKVVISAHSHAMYNCTIDGRLVTSASSAGRMFTRVNLTIDRKHGALVEARAVNVVATRDVPRDRAQTAILDRYRPKAQAKAGEVVGSVTAELRPAQNPAGESALGGVMADAFLAGGRALEKGGAIVAFMNSGGIRGSIVGTGGAPGEGKVTYGDLYTVAPFGNRLTTITLTGDAFRRLLEEQFDKPAGIGVLQVSEGLTYRYRRTAPTGARVVPGSIMLHGRPVAPGDLIKVRVSDFLIGGGDGFAVFAEGRDPVAGETDLEALLAYFRTRSPVAPAPQNRIVRED